MVTALDIPSVREAAVPISVAQYHALVESGPLDSNVELLWGIIVRKMAKSARLTLIVRRLYDQLALLARPGEHCRMEQPLTLESSEPEPDVAVVEGTIEDYPHSHPKEATFVAEVAISAMELDRAKAGAYAAAAIPEYWLLLPNEGCVECYRDPIDGAYQSVTTQEVSKTAMLGCHLGKIDLEALLA